MKKTNVDFYDDDYFKVKVKIVGKFCINKIWVVERGEIKFLTGNVRLNWYTSMYTHVSLTFHI